MSEGFADLENRSRGGSQQFAFLHRVLLAGGKETRFSSASAACERLVVKKDWQVVAIGSSDRFCRRFLPRKIA